jgi:hypothetical protein
MRAISWNMAYWKPSTYKTVENRRRQWSLIAALAPDVALLQECRPADLAAHAPSWLANEYDIIGDIPAGWTACSAVLARRSLRPQRVEPESFSADSRRWVEYLSGYLAIATVEVDGQPLALASVHAIAKPVDHPVVTEADHFLVRRRDATRAWHNHLAVAALASWVQERSFLVGGVGEARPVIATHKTPR